MTEEELKEAADFVAEWKPSYDSVRSFVMNGGTPPGRICLHYIAALLVEVRRLRAELRGKDREKHVTEVPLPPAPIKRWW